MSQASSGCEDDAQEKRVVRAGPWRVPDSPLIAWLVFMALACVAFSDTLASMARTWSQSSAHLHGAFAAPTSIALIWARRAEWAHASFAGSRWPALAGLALCLFALLLARAAGVDVFRQFAFVGVLISGFVVIFGRHASARNMPALAFLLFMPPLGDGIAAPLQLATANVVAAMLSLSGIDVVREGILLTAGGRGFAITESCSGVRLLTAMAMMACLASFIALNGVGRRTVAIGLAVALAFAANWLRVFIVIVLTVLTDDAFGLSHDHFLVGGGAFGIVAAAFFVALSSLRKGDPPAQVAGALSRDEATDGPFLSFTTIAIAMALIFTAAAYERGVIAPAVSGHGSKPESAVARVAAAGWRASQPEAGAWRPDLRHADAIRHDVYWRGEDIRVDFVIGAFAHDRPSAEIAGYETRNAIKANAGAISSRTAELKALGQPARMRITTPADESGGFAIAEGYWLGDRIHGAPHDLRIALARERLAGRSPPGGVFFVYAHGATNSDAIAAISTFLNATEPFERWRARRPDDRQ
ncbi:MAG: exosortase [Alphaproteobacteria bacterium]|nr:exosortase [Alphaproteobacteria bacterium]